MRRWALAPAARYCLRRSCCPPARRQDRLRRGYGEPVSGTSARDEAIAKLGTPTGAGAIGNGDTLLGWIDYSPPHP